MRIKENPEKASVAGPSVIGRVVAILGLFSERRLAIGAADIAHALAISTASAYRYANDLLAAGLLAKSAGRFRLGPKIIELEYLIRSFDPVLRAAAPTMDALVAATGHDVLLCNLYGDAIVNVLHVPGPRPAPLTYTRGLPMPMFRGSQARVILAFSEYRRLKRLYERSIDDPSLADDVRAIGADWPSFSASLRAVRADGHYVSRGELDPGVVGIAAPVLDRDGGVIGSLVMGIAAKGRVRNEGALVDQVVAAAASISAALS